MFRFHILNSAQFPPISTQPQATRGRIKSFDLETNPYGYVVFPTNGIREGTKHSAFNNFEHLRLYSDQTHILSLYMRVILAGGPGETGYMDMELEHIMDPSGCFDITGSEGVCTEDLKDDVFPFVSFCERFPFTAKNSALIIKLEMEGNFLVVRGAGNRFMGKVALPHVECDPSRGRRRVTQIGQGTFGRFVPQVCT